MAQIRLDLRQLGLIVAAEPTQSKRILTLTNTP